jgi:hypothetical protein
MNDLMDVRRQCQCHNWDGYGAMEVTNATIVIAETLLYQLPADIPYPAPGCEPSGAVSLEWYRMWSGGGDLCSVSVYPDGTAVYACTRDGDPICSGAFSCVDGWPADLLLAIRTLTNAWNGATILPNEHIKDQDDFAL